MNMHPIVLAYLRWSYYFKRSLSDEAAEHPEWKQQQKAAWAFLQELRGIHQ
jgi:hypothetical protein